MKAFLIDAHEQTIEPVEIEPSLDAIRHAVGFDTIESDDVRGGDDRLFFDEECFIRQQARPGRFQLDTLPPVAGRGVVVGGGPDESSLRGPEISLEELRGRVKFS
jgi:hypothetical protein